MGRKETKGKPRKKQCPVSDAGGQLKDELEKRVQKY